MSLVLKSEYFKIKQRECFQASLNFTSLFYLRPINFTAIVMQKKIIWRNIFEIACLWLQPLDKLCCCNNEEVVLLETERRWFKYKRRRKAWADLNQYIQPFHSHCEWESIRNGWKDFWPLFTLSVAVTIIAITWCTASLSYSKQSWCSVCLFWRKTWSLCRNNFAHCYPFLHQKKFMKNKK